MTDGKYVIYYVHGMGGGSDSRIPSILSEHLGPEFRVIVKTYDFDPEIAHGQLTEWIAEARPDLVIGESMGAVHAIAVKGVPHLFVSPSLNAPLSFRLLAPLTLIPGVTSLLDRVFRPLDGDRQPLHFERRKLLKWKPYVQMARDNTPLRGSKDYFFAFFGTRDHYRRIGVVLVRSWRRYFGEGTWQMYKGSHFMENEYVHSLLIPKIKEILSQD